MKLVNSCLVLVIATLLYATTVLSFNCPSPCVCRDKNTTIYCNRTGLAEVPKDLPVNTVSLNLGYNQIKSIPKHAFYELIQLKYLDLSGNQFEDTSFQNGALNLSSIQTLVLMSANYTTIPLGLPPNMLTLYLYFNPIKILRANSFVTTPAIQYLGLRYNQIERIEDHVFDPLLNVLEIDLAFNSLMYNSFSPYTFVMNKKLIDLDLTSNILRTLPNTSFFPSSLQRLHFVGNIIRTVQAFALQTLTNLQTLEIWNNAITTVEDNSFYGLNKLTFLSIRNNNISSAITNTTFSGLTGLHTLLIDENNVRTVASGTFQAMKNIMEIRFSSNNLSTLEMGTFDLKFNPQLSLLYIDKNPWTCDCHLRWLREMIDNHPNIIQDPHLIVCNGPPPVAGKAWDVLKPSDFVCKQ